MRKSFFPGTTGIFALFFVPYIVTIIFNGANTTLINKKFNVEMLLPVIVSSQIEDKYELETIKAQTIIARSNFYRTMKEEKKSGNNFMSDKGRDGGEIPGLCNFTE